jgi:hypothetical protein
VYSLRYERHVEPVWDALPDDAREEFDRAILAACEDPYAHTQPYTTDGEVKRVITTQHTRAVLVIINAPPIQRIRILDLTYLG